MDVGFTDQYSQNIKVKIQNNKIKKPPQEKLIFLKQGTEDSEGGWMEAWVNIPLVYRVVKSEELLNSAFVCMQVDH